MLKPIRRKRKPALPLQISSDEVTKLPDEEFVLWVQDRTNWSADLDPETELQKMRQIWAADQISSQAWTITTKRRRETSGIRRVATFDVETVYRFPSVYELEQYVHSPGWGGGPYTISSTRGKKVSYRVVLPGAPEDPYAPLPPPLKKQFKDVIREVAEQAVLRHWKQNPDELLVVAIRMMEKELGIKIAMSKPPDPEALRPYADLEVEEQEWLDDHPDEKDFYVRRQLGLDTLEPEDTKSYRLVEAMKAKIIDEIVNGSPGGSTGLSEVVATLMDGTTVHEVIGQLGELMSTVSELRSTTKSGASVDAEHTQEADTDGGSDPPIGETDDPTVRRTRPQEAP